MAGQLSNQDNELRKRIAELGVLIVDDQPEIRALLRDILSEVGVTTTFEANNGKEALDFVSADFDMVNFIICDWNMPTMTGIDFLKQLRTTHPDMPFLMVTGRSNKNSVVEAKIAGVSAYIRKPFSPKQLEEKLRVLLQKQPAGEH